MMNDVLDNSDGIAHDGRNAHSGSSAVWSCRMGVIESDVEEVQCCMFVMNRMRRV